jgi:hypothetical protein
MTTYQLDKCFDAIKQAGTANSAGLFAGAVPLYYFKDKQPQAPLLSEIKFATELYLIGVVLFAAAYVCFISYIVRTDPNPDGLYEHDGFLNLSIYTICLAVGFWVTGTVIAARVLYLL